MQWGLVVFLVIKTGSEGPVMWNVCTSWRSFYRYFHAYWKRAAWKWILTDQIFLRPQGTVNSNCLDSSVFARLKGKRRLFTPRPHRQTVKSFSGVLSYLSLHALLESGSSVRSHRPAGHAALKLLKLGGVWCRGDRIRSGTKAKDSFFSPDLQAQSQKEQKKNFLWSIVMSKFKSAILTSTFCSLRVNKTQLHLHKTTVTSVFFLWLMLFYSNCCIYFTT